MSKTLQLARLFIIALELEKDGDTLFRECHSIVPARLSKRPDHGELDADVAATFCTSGVLLLFDSLPLSTFYA